MAMLFWLMVLFLGGMGIIGWLMARRVLTHMRNCPEAAELIAKHVIAPILSGGGEQEAKEVFGTKDRPS
ncbi:MAG TPA: hypothetical protein VH592_13285 [Gemmataceae bacterium]|jgi:hypothetical protein